MDDGNDGHSDLLTVLGYAQQRRLDLLPIRWQAAMERIGVGGTAEIRQAAVRSQFSFAFKRVKAKLKQPWRAKYAFKRIIAEILCLTLPAIRAQQHILGLKAICWDIVGASKELWPVLIFEKHEAGDLERFLICEGGYTTIFERLELCGHLALALWSLHQSDECKTPAHDACSCHLL